MRQTNNQRRGFRIAAELLGRFVVVYSPAVSPCYCRGSDNFGHEERCPWPEVNDNCQLATWAYCCCRRRRCQDFFFLPSTTASTELRWGFVKWNLVDKSEPLPRLGHRWTRRTLFWNAEQVRAAAGAHRNQRASRSKHGGATFGLDLILVSRCKSAIWFSTLVLRLGVVKCRYSRKVHWRRKVV